MFWSENHRFIPATTGELPVNWKAVGQLVRTTPKQRTQSFGGATIRDMQAWLSCDLSVPRSSEDLKQRPQVRENAVPRGFLRALLTCNTRIQGSPRCQNTTETLVPQRLGRRVPKPHESNGLRKPHRPGPFGSVGPRRCLIILMHLVEIIVLHLRSDGFTRPWKMPSCPFPPLPDRHRFERYKDEVDG